MLRTVASLLCAVVAFAASSAPAPVYRTPRASQVWVDGWDRPTDPSWKSRFDRDEGRLAITLSAERHELNICEDRLTAPRLMRSVRGDFVMEVRVRTVTSREAGIVLLTGQKGAGASMTIGRFHAPLCEYYSGLERMSKDILVQPIGTPDLVTAYLRLKRQGENLYSSHSRDGKAWEAEGYSSDGFVALGRKVEVGVFATSQGTGDAKAIFDNFSLKPLK